MVQEVASMAMMPNKAPFAAFKVGVVAIAFFGFLAWLLVLGGISALEAVCNFGCRAAYGLPWFIIWYTYPFPEQHPLQKLLFAIDA